MIPLLERAVTTDKKWVKQKVIADILVMGQTIPGSIAVNTATFIGYRLSGVAGAIVGTLVIITPSFIIILLLATLFLNFQHYHYVHSYFMGLLPADFALIALSDIY